MVSPCFGLVRPHRYSSGDASRSSRTSAASRLKKSSQAADTKASAVPTGNRFSKNTLSSSFHLRISSGVWPFAAARSLNRIRTTCISTATRACAMNSRVSRDSCIFRTLFEKADVRERPRHHSRDGEAFSSVRQHRADVGFGDGDAAYLGVAVKPPHGLAAANRAHVVFDGIAGQDRLAKLAFVDGQKIHRAWLFGALDRLDADYARGLRHGLDHHHAGIYRAVRKVTWE